MKPSQKVANDPMSYGFAVNERDFVSVRGYWAHDHQDVTHRWNIHVGFNGRTVEITGLDSLRECRKGVWVCKNDMKKDYDGDFLAISKKHPKPEDCLPTL